MIKIKDHKHHAPAWRIPGRGIVLTLLLAFGFQGVWSQTKTITNLKKNDLTELSLYFYPSTLRMVNLDHNEEFNRLIQDIKKMIFFQMNGKFETIDLYNLLGQLQTEEHFEEYVVVDGPKYKFYLLGREQPAETIGMALVENQHYIFDVAGSLEIKEIPKLYQYIAENDSTFKSKFSQIWGMMNVGQQISGEAN